MIPVLQFQKWCKMCNTWPIAKKSQILYSTYGNQYSQVPLLYSVPSPKFYSVLLYGRFEGVSFWNFQPHN